MEKHEKEIYLAPETNEIIIATSRCIAVSGGIDPSGENPEVPWVI